MSDQNLQAHLVGNALIFDVRRQLDAIIPPSRIQPQSAQIIPFPAPDLSPRPGQSDEDVDACLRSFNRPLERAKSIYAVRLYKTRPDSSTDAAAWGAWYDALTDYQRDILNERNRANGRAAYALARAAEGKEVRPYVRGKTDEQLRADAAARQRKRRAKQGAQPRVDLSQLSPEERRAHKAAQRREQRASARAKAKAAPA